MERQSTHGGKTFAVCTDDVKWALSSWASISLYVSLSHTTSLHLPMLFALTTEKRCFIWPATLLKASPLLPTLPPPQTPLSSLLSLHWEGVGTKARGHTASGHLMDLSTSILLQTWQTWLLSRVSCIPQLTKRKDNFNIKKLYYWVLPVVSLNEWVSWRRIGIT